MGENILAKANNKFGLNLFKVTHKDLKGKNAFLSPFSISAALSMTQIGAREKTAQEMAQVLGWESENGEKIHQQFQAYLTTLQQPSDHYQLSTANRIFLEKSYTVVDDFKNKTKEWYLAEPVHANFIEDAGNEAKKINSWVLEQTQNKIQDLFPPGVLNSLTRLVLVNAIYFKGQWEHQFDPNGTSPRPFKVAPGQTADVPTMLNKEVYGFYKDDDLKATAIEIPYKGKDLAMLIILPDADFGYEEVVEKLDTQKFGSLLKGVKDHRTKIQLFLPKFKITSTYMLKQPLTSLGMVDAFSLGNADFTGMSGQRDLVISEVVHKAFVQVNEEGTEAAAATGAIMMLCSMPLPVPIVEVDHPFLFAIVDKRADGSLLFLGQITSTYMLKQPLTSLGMVDAFSLGNADFTGMSGQRDLVISEVVHKAFVQVNEEGTEAAAATGAIMMMRCLPLPVPIVEVDHPFLFAIVDKRADGSLLFLGLVDSPSV